MLLRTHRTAPLSALRASRTGFTLLEVLVVVAIIVMLAGVGGFYLMQRYEDAKLQRAKIDTMALSDAVENYKLNNHEYPTSIEQLAQPQPSGMSALVPLEKTRDPWGKPYQIDPNGTTNQGLKADVFTTSPRGQRIGNN